MADTFLIADDSAQKIAFLRMVLHAAKWDGDVLVANTTEDAKTLIDAHDVDAAFIDYYMPSEHGPAVIAYLRERRPSAKIALVSSADNAKNFAEAKAAGADAAVCSTLDDSHERLTNLLHDWRLERTA